MHPFYQIYSTILREYNMDATLVAARSLPDTFKIDRFDGSHFRCWQERIYSTLDMLNLTQYLIQPEPQEGS